MSKHYRYLLHNSGPALWPDYKSLEEVLDIRDTTPPHIWSATFQGLATPPGGTVFKRNWFNRSGSRFDDRATPSCLARYISIDTALKAGENNDPTAYVVGELSTDYRLYIRKVEAHRLEFPDLTRNITEWATLWTSDKKLSGVLIEDKASGTSAIQTLKATAPDWLASLIFGFIPTTDKLTRASQAGVWCSNQSVLLPILSSEHYWLADFEDELFNFPGAAHDDRVDALSQLVLYLEAYLEAGFHNRKQLND
jgi:predicted phage terminase large subunit-like protein